jgi:hypothetical protein
MMGMDTALRLIAIPALLIILSGIWLWVKQDAPARVFWGSGVTLYYIHALVFNSYIVLVHFAPWIPKVIMFTEWSTLLRMHEYGTWVLIVVFLTKLNGRIKL